MARLQIVKWPLPAICWLAVTLAASLAAPYCQALTPPPPLPEAELIEFYEAMDGDSWFRNDGWLDPEVEICDWYGIECRANPDFGFTEVADVVLPDNNLAGVLADTGILSVPARTLDLSGNRISGPLVELPLWISSVDLSRNQLAGLLPSVTFQGAQRLTELNLSLNQFEGTVPEDWAELELRSLDLSNNSLDGGAENAFSAIRADGGNRLNLADNRFAGPLSPAVMATGLWEKVGLNLCWNEFVIDDAGLAEWISAHHVGGANWAECLGRERREVDLTVSGSWYVPERSGEGVSLQLLEGGGVLLYHFTFDLDGRQLWMFEVGRVLERHMDWPLLRETRGDFGKGLRVFDEDWRAIRGISPLRIDRLDEDLMHFERELMDLRDCPPLEEPPPEFFFPCVVRFLADRFDNTRLTRLAGTTCDNQDPSQWISGAWYDPDRSGEGFMVEVIDGNRAVVYWFTYRPDDSGLQAWMIGVGDVGIQPISDPPPPGGNARVVIEVDDLVQPIGGVWGSEFDRDRIDRVHWGTLTLEFFDGDTGHVFWDSVFEDYGAGDHPLIRLARPMLAECGELEAVSGEP